MSTRTALACTAVATLALSLIATAGLAQQASPVTAGGDKLPIELMDEFDIALEPVVNRLADAKDEDGNHNKRGVYSRDFRKIDENTYKVTFYEDTAGKDRVLCERYDLTLTRDGSGKGWNVTGKELQASYDGLIRSVVGDEEFYAFDSFTFDHEGLKVTATHGELYRDFTLGKMDSFMLVAPDLAFEYEVPDHVPYDKKAVVASLREEYSEYILDSPDWFSVGCDASTCEELWNGSFENLRKQSGGAPGSQIKKVYDNQHTEEWRDALRKDGFAGFGRPYEEGQRAFRATLRGGGADARYLGLNYDNLAHHEIGVWFGTEGWGGGNILTYHSRETRNAGIDPYELEWRSEGSDRDYDVESVKGVVRLAVKDSETVEADLEYVLNIKRDLREIQIYMDQRRLDYSKGPNYKSPSLIINRLEGGDGNPLLWAQTGPAWGYVVFPDGVKGGTQATVRIAFESQKTIYKANPTYSAVSREAWLPFVDPNDFIGEYDLTVAVPDRYVSLGVGTPVSTSNEDDLRITRYTSNKKVSFPTVIFGDYISDKPRTTAKKLDGTEIPVNIYVDRTATHDMVSLGPESTYEDYQKYLQDVSAGRWGVRVKYLPGLAAQAVNALNLYRELYGIDFPFQKLDLVNALPQGGQSSLSGQSPASMVYLGNLSFRGEGELATALQFAGRDASSTKFVDSLVAHETGHQWWGGLVNNANRQNYWFIESLTEFGAALFVEAVNSDGGKKPDKGFRAYLDHVEDWRTEIMDYGLNVAVQDAPINFTGRGGYRAGVYSKGPYAFHMMRMLYGDEKMYAFLRKLGTTYAGKYMVTRDIQRTAEESLGVPMEWFFDQWIRSAGIPEFTLDYRTRQAEDKTWIVEGTVRQTVVVGENKIPVDGKAYMAKTFIKVLGVDQQEYSKEQFIRGPQETFRFKVPVEPLEVTLNDDGTTLAHDVVAAR